MRAAECTLAALLAACLSGCGYLEGRLRDAGDMFFVSGGAGFGLSASVFAAPLEVVAGASASNVYGWEGRAGFHRREWTASMIPVLGLNLTQQEEAHGGSWWSLPRKLQAIIARGEDDGLAAAALEVVGR
ncbi:MAG: hypothetical protein HY721_33970 [Planctomycetes bacterium]|nr:hypothetical protein [Planctomycetota bacterium]